MGQPQLQYRVQHHNWNTEVNRKKLPDMRLRDQADNEMDQKNQCTQEGLGGTHIPLVPVTELFHGHSFIISPSTPALSQASPLEVGQGMQGNNPPPSGWRLQLSVNHIILQMGQGVGTFISPVDSVNRQRKELGQPPHAPSRYSHDPPLHLLPVSNLGLDLSRVRSLHSNHCISNNELRIN